MSNKDKRIAIIATITNNPSALEDLLYKNLVDVDMEFNPDCYYDVSDEPIQTGVRWTLLHNAAYEGSYEVVKVLLKYKAHTSIRSNTTSLRCTKFDEPSWDLVSEDDDVYYDLNTMTALEVAEDYRHDNIVQLLKQYV